MAKKIRNFAAILAVSAVVGTILLVLVFLLPVGPMRKNVEKSVGDMLKTGDEIPEDAFSQYLWKNRETYTDAIMVQNAIERLPDKNAYEHAMWMYHYDLEEDVWTPEDSLKSFCESHENVNNMYLHIYARYWHGYLLYLKPLLLLFSWQHVVWLELAVQIASISSRLGKTTIELEHISKGFGDKHLINDFSYIVLRDDRIGFIGPNGCGKSTLMKMIMGILQPDEGNITIGDTVKIGYFAQENEDMTGDIRVIDYIRNVAEYIQTTKGQASASQMLDRFLFPPELQYTPLDKLSGGEQRRLYLLKVLMEAPNVLILDEPTNDLDIQTLTILEDYLDTFAGIVITVSHDRYFLDRIVNRIFAFEEGGHLKQYEGGYTDYLEKVKPIAKQEKSKPEKKENNGKKFQKEHQKKLKFTYKEQKEFETIDDDIAKLEEKIEQLDEEIMENATNSGKLAELTQQKEETEEALNEKMDRWVYLNDLAEQIANQ